MTYSPSSFFRKTDSPVLNLHHWSNKRLGNILQTLLRHTAQLLGFKDLWEEVWRTLSALPEPSEGPVNHRRCP
ncbi:hypothetical protein Q8A67_024638 [Cirrhinus molitorella]|uniref:Uncharacterized protein n=1 Tax=Cirrhinus molitorella TaxID=172907 RepID=A0AA88NYV3_9TELE|nr:hypothetical protein Q8A67_024638 [Cirrhinus molitorella]